MIHNRETGLGYVPAIPYKGSKRKIASRIVEAMPPAECFVDLFAGGGAVTSAAMLCGKYRSFVMNDIAPGLTAMFAAAVRGEYRERVEWVSREDFFAKKDTDPFIRYIWSFGNNGETYMYGVDVEAWKQALHYAYIFGDFRRLLDFGVYPPAGIGRGQLRRWIVANKGAIRHVVRLKSLESLERLQSLESLQSLERLQSLQRMESLQSLQSLESLQSLQSLQSLESLQSLQRLQKSYEEVTIPDNAVVYCDIPYKNTSGYGKSGFDHERFYDWVRKCGNPVFVSEYEMPDDFEEVLAIRHISSYSATNVKKTVERLFVHRK